MGKSKNAKMPACDIKTRRSERLKTRKLLCIQPSKKVKIEIITSKTEEHDVKTIRKMSESNNIQVSPSEGSQISHVEKNNSKIKSQTENKFSCPFCQKLFKSNTGVILHVSQKHKNACYQCKKVLESDTKLSEHLQTHGIFNIKGRRMFKCDLCNKSFNGQDRLRIHKFAHISVQTFECNICHQKLKTERTLHYHMKTKHDHLEKRFSCETCGKHFWSKSDLKIHRRSHTNDRPYMCDMCSKTFKYSGNLVEHQKRKHEKQLFLCDLCGVEFNIKRDYLYHRLREHDIKEDFKNELKAFPCDTCGKIFNQKHDLKVHFRIHTGAKPYKCEVCLKAFRCWNHLKQHRVSHTGEKPYPCKYCSKRFSQNANVNAHMKKVCLGILRFDKTPKDEIADLQQTRNLTDFESTKYSKSSRAKSTNNDVEMSQISEIGEVSNGVDKKVDNLETMDKIGQQKSNEKNTLNKMIVSRQNEVSAHVCKALVSHLSHSEVLFGEQKNKGKELFVKNDESKSAENSSSLTVEDEKQSIENIHTCISDLDVKVEKNSILSVSNHEIILEGNNQIVHLVSVPGQTVSNVDSKESVHFVSVPGKTVSNVDSKESVHFVSVPGQTVSNSDSEESVNLVSVPGQTVSDFDSEESVHLVSVPGQNINNVDSG